MPINDGGLGSHLVGDKISIGSRNLHVTKLIGEGGFSYVYLVKEQEGLGLSLNPNKNNSQNDDAPMRRASGAGNHRGEKPMLVLKVTSIHSRAQREIAEKEAKLLSRLSHPSIIKMYDTCYRQVAHTGSSGKRAQGNNSAKERPQHLILMEFCEGGHALDVCNQLAQKGEHFDLGTLIIAFGQICNAVSYLHAQRPPIVHRDLKPVNFLVKNGAYKLCDFGSAVFGHVDLRTPKARAEAEEVIQKTTTQMFRAPEMVDLYMAKKLTQATDVWALGCCLYSLAFLQNCFEEGSNLAILSGKYTIPEDNPYGDGLVELLERMLTSDSKTRADMTEVILCLSAVYSRKPLPPRKKSSKVKAESSHDDTKREEKKKDDKSRIGSFRTDGQGIQEPVYDPTKATEGKKLASNSVAARRKRAAASSAALPVAAPTPAPAAGDNSDPLAFSSFHTDFSRGNSSDRGNDQNIPFGSDMGFGDMKGFDARGGNAADFFGSFDDAAAGKGDTNNAFDAAFDTGAWGDSLEGAQDQAHHESSDQNPMVSQDAAEAGDGKNDSPDSQRKERSRRRRAGSSSRSNKPGSLESGAEAMSIGDGPMPASDVDKKDRRSRSTRSEEDKEHRRRRSGSRSKRKPRPPRDVNRPDRAEETSSAIPGNSNSGTGPKRGNSFRTMFNREK